MARCDVHVNCFTTTRRLGLCMRWQDGAPVSGVSLLLLLLPINIASRLDQLDGEEQVLEDAHETTPDAWSSQQLVPAMREACPVRMGSG